MRLFSDAQLTFDVRNLPTPPEGLSDMERPEYTGNIFFGDKGFMIVDHKGFKVFKSAAASIAGEAGRGSGAGGQEKYEKVMDEKPSEEDDTAAHMKNFLDGIRARDHRKLHADIEIGARAAAFCHLANIGYRAGHSLRMNPSTVRFVQADDANALLTRDYRKPYVVPENV